MDRAIVVSADGHASMPERLWAEYLERDYHDYLPQLIGENKVSNDVLWLFHNLRITEDTCAVFDHEGLYADERWRGLEDVDVRIEEMDREGVAAELVYFGDFRTQDLFFNVMNGRYPLDVIDAGVRVYDRWAVDTFGSATDRLLLSGGVGTTSDVPATIAELEWIAERGFVGTYAPGFVAYPHLPPLYDEFWEPIWASVDAVEQQLEAELELTVEVVTDRVERDEELVEVRKIVGSAHLDADVVGDRSSCGTRTGHRGLLEREPVDVAVGEAVRVQCHGDRQAGRLPQATHHGVAVTEVRGSRGAGLHLGDRPGVPEQRRSHRPGPLAQRHLPVDPGGELDLFEDDLDHAVEQFVLVCDVLVERHRRSAELLSEVPHAQRVDSVAVGELDGCADDARSTQPLPGGDDAFGCLLLDHSPLRNADTCLTGVRRTP